MPLEEDWCSLSLFLRINVELREWRISLQILCWAQRNDSCVLGSRSGSIRNLTYLSCSSCWWFIVIMSGLWAKVSPDIISAINNRKRKLSLGQADMSSLLISVVRHQVLVTNERDMSVAVLCPRSYTATVLFPWGIHLLEETNRRMDSCAGSWVEGHQGRSVGS